MGEAAEGEGGSGEETGGNGEEEAGVCALSVVPHIGVMDHLAF